MNDLVQPMESPEQLTAIARDLRMAAAKSHFSLSSLLEIFERWSAALSDKGTGDIPGVAFLRLWLRRGTLEPIIERELGTSSTDGGWQNEGRARLRSFPVGVVGHWPAANIEIQPVLSLTCALLGGNACLVRVPSGLIETTRRLIESLRGVDEEGMLGRRIALASFDHSRMDLHEAMARSVDGAMIWGGEEAVTTVRRLPFPHWARTAVFGPRLSVAAMDAKTWSNPEERATWRQRIARDVWQFDQQACSSPQALFLERGGESDLKDFIEDLRKAFAEENRVHPRTEIQPAQTAAICLARATWLLEGAGREAIFPETPDWTILVGNGSDIPKPTQGRTLYVLVVDDLMEAVGKFGGAVQTLGMALGDSRKEAALADAAGAEGVDRIVKLGRMHVFGSPWDGTDLIRPMVRLVRHIPSLEKEIL
jgi:hypothetical protein